MRQNAYCFFLLVSGNIALGPVSFAALHIIFRLVLLLSNLCCIRFGLRFFGPRKIECPTEELSLIGWWSRVFQYTIGLGLCLLAGESVRRCVPINYGSEEDLKFGKKAGDRRGSPVFFYLCVSSAMDG